MKPVDKNLSDDQQTESLVEKIMPLAREIAELNKQAEAMGIFTNHRDLAECEACQLFEDVSAYGELYVHRGEPFDKDTGLRFNELDGNAVQCPGCGRVFCPYEADLHCWPEDD